MPKINDSVMRISEANATDEGHLGQSHSRTQVRHLVFSNVLKESKKLAYVVSDNTRVATIHRDHIATLYNKLHGAQRFL